ncbi:MAG: type II secretion system protein [Phycisphaerae bacterium]
MSISHSFQSSRRSRNGFTLIELLVVISIIALLIALLLPALARAKEEALSTACGANLRSIGQILTEYENTYQGNIPFGWALTSSWGSDPPNDWDYLLYCYDRGLDSGRFLEWYSGGVVPGYPTVSTSGASYLGTFVCPASDIPVVMGPNWNPMEPAGWYWTSYAANPNYFYLYLDQSWDPNQTFKASNVQNPAYAVAVGDGTETASWGGGIPVMSDWSQNARSSGNALPYVGDPNYLVPANGFLSNETTNQDIIIPGGYNGDEGMRYRHLQDSPSSGDANALFFDGHVETLPINSNVAGAAVTSPSANGTSGLRIMNIINPGESASEYSP